MRPTSRKEPCPALYAARKLDGWWRVHASARLYLRRRGPLREEVPQEARQVALDAGVRVLQRRAAAVTQAGASVLRRLVPWWTGSFASPNLQASPVTASKLQLRRQTAVQAAASGSC
jgi:hypothetical protein